MQNKKLKQIKTQAKQQPQLQQQQQPQQQQPQYKKSIWTPIVHFAGHTAVGTALFFVVGIPAVLLSFLVHALEAAHVDGFTVEVLKFLEHAILVADAGLFIIFLVITFIKSVKEMLK